MIPCVRFNCYVRFILTPPHSCNTRYEWLVRPCSAGTFTLQEMAKLRLALKRNVYSAAIGLLFISFVEA